MKKAEIKLLIEDDTITFESDNMDQITIKDLIDFPPGACRCREVEWRYR